VSPDAEHLPLLEFASLHPGRKFGPSRFQVGAELVAEFIALTGDDNPIYRDDAAARTAGLEGPIVPPGLAGVWARLAYATGYKLPPGGVMAAQRYRILAPIPVGKVLTLDAEVLEADLHDPKRRVVLGCRARDGERVVGTVEIDARWGAAP
jgi:acyl dehydratase